MTTKQDPKDGKPAVAEMNRAIARPAGEPCTRLAIAETTSPAAASASSNVVPLGRRRSKPLELADGTTLCERILGLRTRLYSLKSALRGADALATELESEAPEAGDIASIVRDAADALETIANEMEPAELLTPRHPV
jgi:hypothetical protein